MLCAWWRSAFASVKARSAQRACARARAEVHRRRASACARRGARSAGGVEHVVRSNPCPRWERAARCIEPRI
eukprot:10940469-Lingulodinium_polyedra.AAC.1